MTVLPALTVGPAQVPAPGQRQAIEYELQKGGKFSEAKPKSDIEWRMLKAAEIPAPGQRQNIATQGTSGGKFNMGKSKSEVEWAIHRAKTVPGAGEYSVPSSFQAAPRRIDDLRKAFKTKVLKKSAFDTAAEQFAAGNKGLLSSLRKARFEKLGRRLSQDLEAQQNAAAAAAAAAAADAGGDAQAEAEASL